MGALKWLILTVSGFTLEGMEPEENTLDANGELQTKDKKTDLQVVMLNDELNRAIQSGFDQLRQTRKNSAEFDDLQKHITALRKIQLGRATTFVQVKEGTSVFVNDDIFS